jgi:LmbE family N-acetylglucosaminyl deacetylase
MKILAVGAHPDDLEICCAGTLAKYVKEGHEVTMCHALNGDKGHFHIPPEKLGPMRVEEARRGAEVIGCKSLYIGYNDC